VTEWKGIQPVKISQCSHLSKFLLWQIFGSANPLDCVLHGESWHRPACLHICRTVQRFIWATNRAVRSRQSLQCVRWFFNVSERNL